MHASDPRYRKRVPCRLQVAGSAHSGMVLNVSRTGMFVQTTAGAGPGHAVHLDLVADGPTALSVDARVIWRRVVPPHLRTVSTGGMGVKIQYASDAYFGFVAGLASTLPVEAAEVPRSVAAAPSYRVHLRLAGSPRTRSVVVAAKDEREARERACRQAGAQWAVLGVEKLEREA
jgi:hypothetical protein